MIKVIKPEYQPRKCKSYSEIFNILKDAELLNVSTEVVCCVSASLPRHVSQATFELLCKYIEYIWQKAQFDMNIQKISDIVCDLYLNCDWGYRNISEHRILKRDNLKNLENREIIYEIYGETMF